MVCNPQFNWQAWKNVQSWKKKDATKLKKQCSAFKCYPAAKMENNFFKIFYYGQAKDFKKRVITEGVKLKGQIQVFHASWENNGDDDNYNTYIHTSVRHRNGSTEAHQLSGWTIIKNWKRTKNICKTNILVMLISVQVIPHLLLA